MKNISKNKLLFIVLLAVCGIIVLAWFAPLQRTAGVAIATDVGISQGAVENDSEYLMKRTVPKTVVNVTIRFEWMENGQLKTTESVLSSNGSDSSGRKNNYNGKLIYGNATVESIEIMALESFPVQIKVSARGYCTLPGSDYAGCLWAESGNIHSGCQWCKWNI